MSYPYQTKEAHSVCDETRRFLQHLEAGMCTSDREAAFTAVSNCLGMIDEISIALFYGLYIECPKCKGDAAEAQEDACPCCVTFNGYIPRHLFKQIKDIWQQPSNIVTCPICDGECDVLIEDKPCKCPACGGLGEIAKEYALSVIRTMHYEEQGIFGEVTKQETTGNE